MAKKSKNYEIYPIDNKDAEIIKILEDDGRISVLELAKKVKLSHETVRYRINKLVRKGVIEKFTVSIDKKKLGYNLYAVIMIAIWNYTPAEWEEFINYLLKHNSIIAVEKITGDYDLKIAMWTKDSEELDMISHTIKTKFSKIIKSWQSFIFTKQYKWKELPF